MPRLTVQSSRLCLPHGSVAVVRPPLRPIHLLPRTDPVASLHTQLHTMRAGHAIRGQHEQRLAYRNTRPMLQHALHGTFSNTRNDTAPVAPPARRPRCTGRLALTPPAAKGRVLRMPVQQQRRGGAGVHHTGVHPKDDRDIHRRG
ncbi:hypothetical protein MSAN_01303700 [Mycena sanguinolenta]|uniref:Uncharacterized protein n=1 Tax=Mycena sanguinolenta TaxID=230812 RepID=A0A8H6YF08_9AGAR|nr:hypothetical protein MSAN_01303700 [Mycena sanguinolenta]